MVFADNLIAFILVGNPDEDFDGLIQNISKLDMESENSSKNTVINGL